METLFNKSTSVKSEEVPQQQVPNIPILPSYNLTSSNRNNIIGSQSVDQDQTQSFQAHSTSTNSSTNFTTQYNMDSQQQQQLQQQRQNHDFPSPSSSSSSPMPHTRQITSNNMTSSSIKSNINNNNNKNNKLKKIACTECRQQKAKCDAHEQSPNPCTRCVKRGIHCNLKSDYKRTFKRAKIAEMEKEYEQMRKKLITNPQIQLIPQQQVQQQVQQVQQQNSPSQLPPISSFSSPNTYQPITRYISPTPPPGPLTSSSLPPHAYASPSPITHQQQQPQQVQQHPTTTGYSRTMSMPMIGQTSTGTNMIPPLIQPTHQQRIPVTQSIYQNNNIERDPHSTIDSVLETTPKEQNVMTNQGPSVIRAPLTSHSFFGTNIPSPIPVSHTKPLPSETICSPKSLGEVTLTSDEIKVLFIEFVENYHSILPVVDVTKGIERIFRLCPVLFWTIMSIALRRHNSSTISKEKSHNIYLQLTPILKSALAEITISPITRYAPTEVEEPILNVSSVYSVQAFLLYTFWPPLTSSLSADTSWNTIGIAIFQAIRIGLHSPGHSSDGMKTTNVDLLKEQIRTWIGCNIVSQTIATAFGFPGFVQLDTSLLISCKPENSLEIPNSLRQMVEIQLFEEQVAKTMNSNPLDPLRLVDASEKLSLLHLLNRELDQLQIKLCSDFTNPIDDLRRLSLFSARLHTLTYNFLDTERIATFELSRGLVKAYNSALAVITHCRDAQSRDKSFIRYLPGVYVLTIWQASCIIAKLVHSPYNKLIDIGAGKELYQCAISLTLKASVMKHDMAHRSSGIMRITWALFKTLYEQQNTSSSSMQNVTVRSRMCASVFFDCLWILREKSGMIKLAPRPKNLVSIDENAVAESGDESASSSSEEYEDRSNSNSDSDDHDHEIPLDSSLKGTPNSSTSSQSAHKKKFRSLSNTLHPESSARKIINTIPLDPQPISLGENNNQENSVSSNSSAKTSPFVNQHLSYKSSPDQKKSTQVQPQQPQQQLQTPPTRLMTHRRRLSTSSTANQGNNNTNNANNANNAKRESPIYPLDSWDLVNDIDSDLLFKDIDSVMNDFGFHAD
ncbi:hypothetical protein CANARDRAFT_30462 [[Candida] arabinofermentans NRRL YB-2248]|uniref:Zn(2)-C6 fungal-type domain-containing protein n=1 Tax=[Candida] arabinofermentans NRRL YB-2248 TaxID=983967 RepID=A0A1E4STR4_9ASCO|nr:hypothetical protein CANARDRAFT_30462 [[Candida] arabinofermentans NRRL YB-2248]